MAVALAALSAASPMSAQTTRVPVTVQQEHVGAPVTFGLPLPRGDLYAADNVRVLNARGDEIPAQITAVTTWQPADASLKWIWVDMFLDGSGTYTVEYGADVRRTAEVASPIRLINNQREYGFAEIDTGPLRLTIRKGGSGFLDTVEFNPQGTGYSAEHVIAESAGGRGSFLDLMDAAGIDTSSAVIHQHYIEKGSGPLHAIVRVEGEYQYSRADHAPAPFVTYVHAYAGKSYVKVLHTITYTGVPDRSDPLDGRQHRDIATQAELLVDEEARRADAGLTVPEDMIAAAGFALNYHVGERPLFRTALIDGPWWGDGSPELLEMPADAGASVVQLGPDRSGGAPAPESDLDNRIDGFLARVEASGTVREAQRSEGWVDLSGASRGISVGIRNMVEEYPNQFVVDGDAGVLRSHIWPPDGPARSFARWSNEPDGGMVGNFAQGITKTSELVFYFHDGQASGADIRGVLGGFLDPSVAHAGADWYRNSGVYGTFAAADNTVPVLERSLQYKFDYMHFNREWAPWFGMFDFGDFKNYLRGGRWTQWGNNEPGQDFQWWFNFMRTGDRRDHLVAEATSRHTMDVDNTHWPVGPVYRGDSNSAFDYWKSLEEPPGSPYLGMGSRHSNQQAISKLSAHVWIPGWIASYYLNGYHRGLAVARLTGDYYLRRVFGEHGLTGRRLYLSVWNLVELYDATKDEVYAEELHARVDRMLELQKRQGGRMVIDRYGYSQNYASHGLSKYLQIFEDEEVALALREHARSLLLNPPLDHEMESYLASIHALVRGYDLTNDPRYLVEACHRATHLRTAEIARPIDAFGTQRELALEMERISNLPGSPEAEALFSGRHPIWSYSNGLRIFGWTHAYGVPYLIDRIEKADASVPLGACTSETLAPSLSTRAAR